MDKYEILTKKPVRGGYIISRLVQSDFQNINHLVSVIETMLDEKEKCIKKVNEIKKITNKYMEV